MGYQHVKWSEFLQEFTFVLKHRAGVDNEVVDALSRKAVTLQSISAKVVRFDQLIHEYPTCRDFGEIYLYLT